jgi:hypothetical protein
MARRSLALAVVVGCSIGALAFLTRDSESFDITYGAA